MTISFQCPRCHSPMQVADSAAGRTGKCPQCGGPIQVPRPSRQGAFTASRPPVQGLAAAAHSQSAAGIGRARSPWPMLAMLISGGAALAVCVLMLTLVFTGGGEASITQLKGYGLDTTFFMPDRCTLLITVRVDEAMASSAFSSLKAAGEDLAKGLPIKVDADDSANQGFGLPAEDIESITMGFDILSAIPKPDAIQFTAVVEAKRDITAAEIKGKLKDRTFTESKIGNYTLYDTPAILPGFGKTPQPAMGFSVVSRRIVVFGSMPAIKDVLTRNQKPVLGEVMSNAIKDLGRPKTFSMILSLREALARHETVEALEQLPPQAKQYVSDVDGLVLQIELGADIDLDAALLMKTESSADELRKLTEGGLAMAKLAAGQMGPEATEMMDAFKFKTEGPRMKVTAHIRTATLTSLMKIAGQKIGQQMGQPPAPPGP